MGSEEAMMLARVRDLAAEAMLLCEELHAPAAANHMQLGFDLFEQRVHPHRFHILPEGTLTAAQQSASARSADPRVRVEFGV